MIKQWISDSHDRSAADAAQDGRANPWNLPDPTGYRCPLEAGRIMDLFGARYSNSA